MSGYEVKITCGIEEGFYWATFEFTCNGEELNLSEEQMSELLEKIDEFYENWGYSQANTCNNCSFARDISNWQYHRYFENGTDEIEKVHLEQLKEVLEVI